MIDILFMIFQYKLVSNTMKKLWFTYHLNGLSSFKIILNKAICNTL